MINLGDYRKVHCVGIGGIGLSAIAEILLEEGYQVSGSDLNENSLTDSLKARGVVIFNSHSSENVKDADLVIYSSAVTEENPELLGAKNMGIPTLSRAEVLGLMMKEYDEGIAISGTHGKTTTTAMISLILKNASLNPTILIGGNFPAIGSNVQLGGKKFIVAEACEYKDSFLSLYPTRKVILNIDSDHLDYFSGIDHIVHSFEAFAESGPASGTLIAYTANPFVNSIVRKHKGRFITFGLSSNMDYWAENIEFDSHGLPSFDVYYRGKPLGGLKLAVPGEHNVINALASIACCHDLGIKTNVIFETLSDFRGAQRRFDILGITEKGVKIVDDYAHHPTEIRVTLNACKNFSHNKLWCIFQPHTFTRTIALLNEFSNAFEDADSVVLAKIFPAREKDIYNISSFDLAEKIKETSPDKEVHCYDTFQEIVDFINKNAHQGDLVITMGAGNIYKVGEMLLEPAVPVV